MSKISEDYYETKPTPSPLPKKTLCANCGEELWINLSPNKIRVLAKPNQEMDITYDHIRVVCDCGHVSEQSSNIIRQIEHLKTVPNVAMASVVSPRKSPYSFDQNQRKMIREKLDSMEQKAVFMELVKQHDEILELKSDDPLMKKISKELSIPLDKVVEHVEAINSIIKKIWPNHFSEIVEVSR